LLFLYLSPFDGKIHGYHPDFMISWRGMKNILIEVKPYHETQPPKKKKRGNTINEQVTYGTNITKWEAAEKWCDDNGIDFIVVHEHNVSDYFPGVKFLSKPPKKKRKKKV